VSTIVIPPPSYSYDIRNLFYEKGEKQISTHASHLSRCSRLWGMALADPYTVVLSLPEWAHGPASTGIVIEPYVLSQLEGEIFPAPAEVITGKTYEMRMQIGPYDVEVVGTPDAYVPEHKILIEIKTTTSDATSHRVAQGDVPWPWLIQLGVYAELLKQHFSEPAIDKCYTACYSTTTGEIYVNEHSLDDLKALIDANNKRLAEVFSNPDAAKLGKCDDFWGSCLCNVLGGKKIKLNLMDFDEGDDREVIKLIETYLDNAKEIEQIEAVQQEIREKLAQYIPLGASLTTDEAHISHHVQSTKRCNYQLLQAKDPKLYEEVITVSESPRLVIRRKGGKND
jgi:hypothetical protein